MDLFIANGDVNCFFLFTFLFLCSSIPLPLLLLSLSSYASPARLFYFVFILTARALQICTVFLSFTLHSFDFQIDLINMYDFSMFTLAEIHSHSHEHALPHVRHKAKGIQSSFVYRGNGADGDGNGGYWVHTAHTRNKHDQMFESFLLLLAPFRLRSLC